MGLKDQIEKDRELLMEMTTYIREEERNAYIAYQALKIAWEYLNKADRQRQMLSQIQKEGHE